MTRGLTAVHLVWTVIETWAIGYVVLAIVAPDALR
jgi:hypothetical protein